MVTHWLSRALTLACALTAAAGEAPWVLGTRPSRAPASLDCPLRQLVVQYASALNSVSNETDIARSLLLSELCPHSAPLPSSPPAHQIPRPRWEAPPPANTPDASGLCSLSTPPPLVFFVAPDGSDDSTGSQAAPFATLARALVAVGADDGMAACIWVRGGTFHTSATIVVGRSNLEIASFPGEAPILSGATPFLTPTWTPFAMPNASASCWVATGAAPRGLNASALFDADAAGGARYIRARWPNSARSDAPFPTAWSTVAEGAWLAAPPEQRCESQVTIDTHTCFANYSSQGGMAPCFESRTGCGSLRFDPPLEPGTLRSVCGGAYSPLCNTVPGGLALPDTTPWPFAHPEDLLVHYMKQIDARGLAWYSLTWAAVAANASARSLELGVGGFQSGQGRVADGTKAPFSLEGALELLDAEGEYHYDGTSGDVYVCGAPGSGAPAISTMQLSTQPYLLSLEGGGNGALRGVSVRGLSFAHTRSTILEGHAVPGGGDLAAHPRGALTLRDVEGVTVAGCTFVYAGGSAIVISGHALGVQIVDSGVYGAGAHGVLVLGSSILSNATGPDLPRGVRIAGNVLRGTGTENKFAAAIAVALAPRAVIEGNVAYEMPRTAIYFNDVAASSGQLMQNNVIFNTNRETTDTGPVYVYNRLAFLGDNVAGPSVIPDVSNHTANLIFNNYGGDWPLDYDDGTRHVQDFGNVLIYGGSKQYLGCCTRHFNSFFVYPDLSDNNCQDCALHSGAELYHSGYDHAYFNNTCVLSAGSATAYKYSSCNASNSIDPPRVTSHDNIFLSPAGAGGLAAIEMNCAGSQITMAQWQVASGMEEGSTTGPLPDPIELAARLLAFLPGPQASGSGSAWGI